MLQLWVWIGLAWGQTGPTESPTEPDAPRELVVAISPFKPFVSLDGDAPAGFSIDLWRAVAAEEGLTYRFETYANVTEKLGSVSRGQADLAIGGISITLEREQALDFTLPTFRTGLTILVPDEAPSAFSPRALVRAATPARLGILLGFFALIVISGHLVWWTERGRDAFDDRYLPGVLEGMYWALVTASTVGYGDYAPVRWLGRLVAALVIVVSLPMFALFTAELASTLTVSTLEGEIASADDLRGHRIGVVRGTTGEQSVRELGGSTVGFDTPEQAVDALLAGQIEAVVHDAPNLIDFTRHHSGTPLHTVGSLFEPQRYGVAVPQGSHDREVINRALLSLQESGAWDDIRIRWFSGDLGR